MSFSMALQHQMGVSGLRGNRSWQRSWRPLSVALYMGGKGGNTVQPFPMAARIEAYSADAVLVFLGLRASGGEPPRLPGDTPAFWGRSNGVDMDALIKPLRPGKPSDVKPSDARPSDAKPSDLRLSEIRPAELDPAEFLAAAVRADQPRPSRAEAEQAV